MEWFLSTAWFVCACLAVFVTGVVTFRWVEAWETARLRREEAIERIALDRIKAAEDRIQVPPSMQGRDVPLCSRADDHDGPCNGWSRPSCMVHILKPRVSNNPEPEAL